MRDSLASLDRIREVLGYEPTISFGEGLRRTVARVCRRFCVDGPATAPEPPQPDQLTAARKTWLAESPLSLPRHRHFSSLPSDRSANAPHADAGIGVFK